MHFTVDTKCIEQKNKYFANEESRDNKRARSSSTYYNRQQKKPLSIWKSIEQCATYIRFQTIILNKVMLKSVMFQQRKRALKAKLILQLPPSCYGQNTRIQLISLWWMTSILNYNARNMEKTAWRENWDEESWTKMMTRQIVFGVWYTVLHIFTVKSQIFQTGREKFYPNSIIWRQVMCLRCNSMPGSRCQRWLQPLLCQTKNKTKRYLLIRKWQRSAVQSCKQKCGMRNSNPSWRIDLL